MCETMQAVLLYTVPDMSSLLFTITIVTEILNLYVILLVSSVRQAYACVFRGLPVITEKYSYLIPTNTD